MITIFASFANFAKLLPKFKIGLKAFKSRTLIMGLKNCKKYKILLHLFTKKNFQALRAQAWGLI
jgi:hypothetical protein